MRSIKLSLGCVYKTTNGHEWTPIKQDKKQKGVWQYIVHFFSFEWVVSKMYDVPLHFFFNQGGKLSRGWFVGPVAFAGANLLILVRGLA